MIASTVATQSEIDKALLQNFGLKPTGTYTSDKTQQLYTNINTGKGFMLPSSNQGYSYYSINDILGYVQRKASGAKVVGIHTFMASDQSALKLVEPDN